jgi:hypothetical protein
MLNVYVKQDPDALLQLVKTKLQENNFHQSCVVSDERIGNAIDLACQLCSGDEDQKYQASKKLILMTESYSIFINEYFTMLSSLKAHNMPSEVNDYNERLHSLLKLQDDFQSFSAKPIADVMNLSHDFLQETMVLMPNEHDALWMNYMKIKRIYHGVEKMFCQISERVKSIRQIVFTLNIMQIVFDEKNHVAKQIINENTQISLERINALHDCENILWAHQKYYELTGSLVEKMNRALSSFKALSRNQALSLELIQIHEKHLVTALAPSVC